MITFITLEEDTEIAEIKENTEKKRRKNGKNLLRETVSWFSSSLPPPCAPPSSVPSVS
jgi:hypothetical protein